jgi:hypothetical protein
MPCTGAERMSVCRRSGRRAGGIPCCVGGLPAMAARLPPFLIKVRCLAEEPEPVDQSTAMICGGAYEIRTRELKAAASGS